MAKLDFSFYHNESNYSDGKIEEKMLDFVRDTNSKDSKYDFLKKEWAYFYHFSHLRQNILNWYNFKEKAHILEIGAGCGAITGLLCEKAEKVVSVELTKIRAEINYQRHKNCENLDIVVGNLNNIRIDNKFDYIILNGVFEYAASFTESEKPFHQFLKNTKRFLKEDGIILIAIENRMGLKYFAGAKEDHFGELFYGINGYKDKDYAVTFTKDDLIEIFNEVGMKYNKFYYPYPDYKFPELIFTDDWFGKTNINYNTSSFDYSRYMFFDELKLNNIFANRKIADYFSNSFLIELSKTEIKRESEVLFSKMSANRSEIFRIGTSIELKDGCIYAKKFPLNNIAKQHINSFINKYKLLESHEIGLIKPKIKEDIVYFKYIDGICFENVLVENIKSKDIYSFSENIKKIFDLISSSKKVMLDTLINIKFQKVFGNEMCNEVVTRTKFNNIDINFDNLFLKEDQLLCIDYEWVFDFEIPTEFILWRALKNFYEKYKKTEIFVGFNSICEENGINEQLREIFLCWERKFARDFVGIDDINRFAKRTISKKESIENIIENRIYTNNIYIDTGDGFNDIQRIESEVSLEGENECNINLSDFEKISNLRFDPVEGIPCIVSIVNMNIDGRGLKWKPFNGYELNEGKDIFFSKDPIYQIDSELENPKNLEIKYTIEMLSIDEINEYANSIIKKYRLKQEEQLTIINELKILNSNIENKNLKQNQYISQLETEKSQLETEKSQLETEKSQLETEGERIKFILKNKKIKSIVKIILGKNI